MKKTIKYFIAISLVVVSIAWKLNHNKSINKNESELARISAKFLPVRVDTVQYSNRIKNIESSGSIESKIDLILYAETQGRIRVIHKLKGQKVKKGDLILSIDDEILSAQFESATTNLEFAVIHKNRMKKLFNEKAATAKQVEDADLKFIKAKSDLRIITRQLENTKVKSPVDGYINEDFVRVGMMISSNTKICNIISPNHLIVNSSISDVEISQLSIGDAVSIRSSNYPLKSFEGQVINIAKKATDNNRFNVEVAIQSHEQQLKAGMFVQVGFPQISNQIILVDRSAIEGSMDQASVFLVENDILHQQSVIIKQSFDNRVEIEKGIKPNDILVTSGTINLFDAAKIKIVN